MFSRIVMAMICVWGFAGTAAAQAWTAEQKEIWSLEEQQWKMAAAEDLSWIDTMVHPNLRYWETGDPMPRGKDSLRRWNRYSADNSAVLEQELFPISITVTMAPTCSDRLPSDVIDSVARSMACLSAPIVAAVSPTTPRTSYSRRIVG